MKIIKENEYIHQYFEWGTLTWYASDEIGGSSEMTIGKCIILPGQHNPRHSHPNCEEIMHVTEGRIIHTINDGEIELNKGETIVVPRDTVHHAINIGDHDAELLIVFSTNKREMVKESKKG